MKHYIKILTRQTSNVITLNTLKIFHHINLICVLERSGFKQTDYEVSTKGVKQNLCLSFSSPSSFIWLRFANIIPQRALNTITVKAKVMKSSIFFSSNPFSNTVPFLSSRHSLIQAMHHFLCNSRSLLKI